MDNVIVDLLCIVVVGNLGLLLAWGIGGIVWFVTRKDDA